MAIKIHAKAGMLLLAIFLLTAENLFSQDELRQRGSIPEELLRPRKGEAARYPIDTVIGEMGQGKSPKEAYECAKKAAEAFLAGTVDAPVFASADNVFIESCINALNTIVPRYYRLGSGREEPDGSVSFLVRFAGRDEGIIGELFIRREEKRVAPAPPPPQAAPPETVQKKDENESDADDNNEGDTAEIAAAEISAEDISAIVPQTPPARPETPAPVVITWVFEDIILEEARSREIENQESRAKFDFSPYERIF